MSKRRPLSPLGIQIAVVFAALLQELGGFRQLFSWVQRDYVLPDITDNNGMKLPGLLLNSILNYFGVLDA